MSYRSHYNDVDPLWPTFHLLKPARKICKKLCSPSNCLPTLDFLFTAELRSLSHSDAGCEELVSDVSSVKEAGVKTPQFHMGDTIPLHCLGSTWRRASKPHTHNSTWETPYHALHCFSSTWRSRRQETTILCGEHNSMIFWHNIGSVALEHEEACVKRLQFHEKKIITRIARQ